MTTPNSNQTNTPTLTIQKYLVIDAINRGKFSRANEIFDTTTVPNLDRSLATLHDIKDFPTCPVGAIMSNLLPPEMTVEQAESFIHETVCKRKMQSKFPQVLLANRNYLGALSAYYENELPNKPQMLNFVERYFPEQLSIQMAITE